MRLIGSFFPLYEIQVKMTLEPKIVSLQPLFGGGPNALKKKTFGGSTIRQVFLSISRIIF